MKPIAAIIIIPPIKHINIVPNLSSGSYDLIPELITIIAISTAIKAITILTIPPTIVP